MYHNILLLGMLPFDTSRDPLYHACAATCREVEVRQLDVLEQHYEQRLAGKQREIDSLGQDLTCLNDELEQLQQMTSHHTSHDQQQRGDDGGPVNDDRRAPLTAHSASEAAGGDDDDDGDRFHRVREMLTALKLKYLFPVFEENAIRVSQQFEL